MIGYTLHINQQLHHNKACSRIADMFVKARDMILTDFLLVLLNLTAQTHSVIRNNLIIFL